MSLTRRLPFLRWSFLRLAWGVRNITTTGQVGDGREAAAADFVETRARRGDLDDVIATIDRFAYEHSYLINVGPEKGLLLDNAIRRVSPATALELGTYCGYGALRIARAAPQARVFSVELSAANAEVARRIWAHAGVTDRVSCIVGTIGDGGATLDALGFAPGELDFLFLDHDKDAYLSDLHAILGRGWLRAGAVVVADNVGIPGAPRYRGYMKEHQGTGWRTVEHKTHAEYQTLLTDLVLESDYLGG